jgi:hypothetical protein
MKFDIKKALTLRPYIGFGAGMNIYESIKEEGAGVLGLEVKEGLYSRLFSKIGLDIKRDVKKCNLGAKLEYKVLINGVSPEIMCLLDKVKFKSKGSLEDIGKLKLGLSANYELSRSVTLFANVDYFIANISEEFRGNIGFVYKFGVISILNKKGRMKKNEQNKRIFK